MDDRKDDLEKKSSEGGKVENHPTEGKQADTDMNAGKEDGGEGANGGKNSDNGGESAKERGSVLAQKEEESGGRKETTSAELKVHQLWFH